MGSHGDTTAAGGLGARLAAARHAAFVGRTAELELFKGALAEPPAFAVLHLHGPGGIGKSSLLAQYAHLAAEDDRRVVRLDGRELDPSPEGLLAGLGQAVGTAPDEVVDALATGPSPVLLLDTYELLRPADGWVRDELLPRLPEAALVVLAGRVPPGPGWRADPAWGELLRVVALRDLRAEAAHELLADRGLDERARDRVYALVRGHPLGLVLVADVLGSEGGTDSDRLSLTQTPEVIDTLLRRFLRQAPDDDHRRALHAAALAGVATEALLREVLDTDARAAFDWLRQLSFVAPVADGVAVHDLAAQTLNAELQWRDPDAWTELHAAITRHIERRITRASGGEQHRRLVDLLRLYRHHPVARRFFEIDRTDDRWVEPATSQDHAAIGALTREHEGDASAALVNYWLERQPTSFWAVRRHGSDTPAGFIANLLLRGGPDDEVAVDPVLARVWEHVRAHGPLRGDEGVRVVRFWIMRDGHQPLDAHHLVSARAALDWTTTPDLAWAVAALVEVDRYEPIFEFMEFTRLGTQVDVGPVSYGGFARDMRVTSFRDWLDLLRDRRAGVDDGPGVQPWTPTQRLLVLAQDDFADAVRDALRGVARPGHLEGNPLLRSRVVVEHAGDGTPKEALTALLREVTDELADHPRDAKLHRALAATYLAPAPTQEVAAERLDLPFSTFRRHLAQGIEHVVARLWDLELHGHG